jgi:hypothetical protein
MTMMRQKYLSLVAAAVLLLVLCVSLFGQATPPAGPFSFADPTVRLPAGAQEGMGEIILRSSTPQSAPPTLTDLDLPRPLAAAVTFKLIEDSKAPPNTWYYRAIVSGLPPTASQQHYAVITSADKKQQSLLYTLTNQPAGTFSWTVNKPPDPWVGSDADGSCTAFTVTTKDAPATDVKVFSTLVEQTTKQAITLDALRLCQVGSNCDGTQPVTLVANVPTALQLCTTRGFHGKYDGSVVLTSRQKPEGDVVLQHAQFSSGGAKVFGFVLILLGVIIAFVAKVWARTVLERDQALMPVTLMRSQLKALQQTLAQFKPEEYRKDPTNLPVAIKTLLDELDDKVLDSRHFLPPRVPNPFGFTVDAAGLKAYLETRNPRLQVLSILVNDGVVQAAKEDNGSLSTAQKAEVTAAIKKIDKIIITPPVPGPDQALQQVREIVADLHDVLFPPPQGARLAVARQSANLSFEALQLEIATISKSIWVVYGILTALTGLAFLILSNPGYGVPTDYLLAFFWGFGLPTAVQSLVPSSAATALNISVART